MVMIWASITGNLWRAGCAVLAGLVLALWVQLHGLPIIGGGLIARLDRMTELRRIEADNHRTTKASYRTAMTEAKRMERARLARVKAEQERINDRAKQDFERRLAGLRTRYDSLRAQARTSAASAAGGVTMSGIPAPAFGPNATTDTDGLLAERLECSTYAVQLDELISWVAAQSAVKVNEE
jgi:hypothetical protein